MLTGLLFAIEEAVDRPALLVATLPFAGMTLIEYQARQLAAAGVSQIVVIGDRPTPELLAALRRIGLRGVTVDAVQGAADAAAALHPLARVVMLADGLITTDAVVRLLAIDGGDALLVSAADGSVADLERVDGTTVWAGGARFGAERLAALAAMPVDYDPQSTLVRLAEAAGAPRLSLPVSALTDGHGVERKAASLEVRGQRIVAAAVPRSGGWFNRYVAAPLARLALPTLIARGIETVAVTGATVVVGVAAIVALGAGWLRPGLLLAVASILVGYVGMAAAVLRDERRSMRELRVAMAIVAAAAVLLLGWDASVASADRAAVAIAIALVTATLLIERTGVRSAIGADGASCTFVVAIATLIGWPVLGLILAALYAVTTLAFAIDALRREA